MQRLSSEDPGRLESNARTSTQRRERIIGALRETREKLIRARADEYRDVVVAGQSHPPSEAAREVAEGRGTHDWIPGPVTLGAPLPLSVSEIAELYRTNRLVSPEDERDLGFPLPELAELASPDEIHDLILELKESPAEGDPALWVQNHEGQDPEALKDLSARLGRAVKGTTEEPLWRVTAMQADYLGGSHREPWESLLSIVQTAYDQAVTSQEAILRHDPLLAEDIPLPEQVALLDEIASHVRQHARLTRVALLIRPRWKRLIGAVRVKGRAPRTLEEFSSLRDLALLEERRQELRDRWERQVVPLGAPSLIEFADPERLGAQHAHSIEDALNWSKTVMEPLWEEIDRHGFRWREALASVAACPEADGELVRLRDAILNCVQPQLLARASQIRRNRAKKRLSRLRHELVPGSDAAVVKHLDEAVVSLDPVAYREAYRRMQDLETRAGFLASRRRLLKQLESAAPTWAAAIRERYPPHDGAEAPGEPSTAWLWRQFNDELETRAQASLDHLQQEVVKLNDDLQRVTSGLVECLAWKAQLDRTSLGQRQNLMGWLLTIRRIGRGTGRRVPRLRVEAQRLMSESRDAVPVWIMPLSRVVENFDPRTAQFDVVVIDEASQCDALALIAVYMARKVVIVGDHEQVSPDAVGLRIDEVEHLIGEHLQGIPNAHLYDGQQSIYDIAMRSFGGLICLREHFRCVPDIIQFSNALSYDLQIKALRDASQVHLKPHVVEHRVEGYETESNVNEQEALAAASLLCAAVEQPEYAGKTVGFISLLGEEQARLVDRLLRRNLEPAEYERRRIICGNAAHFQGDERDVMFLSLVHGPTNGPLRLLEAGPHDMYKKRFNVAASRGRDQLWVIHSLNAEADLQAGDLRRRLIEHARDPQALLRRIQEAERRTESEFEKEVLRRLMSCGFRVVPQWHVGSYRIDLVVEGGGGRVAVECDGDRWHPPERLQEDMERQAVLERIGWVFTRVRGTEFYRDPEGITKRVTDRLGELGVHPDRDGSGGGSQPAEDHELLERVIRRAAELREEWKGQGDSVPWEQPYRRRGLPESGREVQREKTAKRETAPRIQSDAPSPARTTGSPKERVAQRRSPRSEEQQPMTPSATSQPQGRILGWPSGTWKAMANWGKETNKLNPVERRFSYRLGQLITWGKEPSERQLKWAKRIQQEAVEQGFTPSESAD